MDKPRLNTEPIGRALGAAFPLLFGLVLAFFLYFFGISFFRRWIWIVSIIAILALLGLLLKKWYARRNEIIF